MDEPTSLTKVEIPRVDGFTRDKDPAWYGRYRLWFDQVSSCFDDYRAFIRIRPSTRSDFVSALSGLEKDQNWPFQHVNQAEHGLGWSFDFGAPDDDFLCFEQLSDLCYIDMRNFNLAIRCLAPYLDDAHFFVYSSGDDLDCWLDEYRISAGVVWADRWMAEPTMSGMRETRLNIYDRLSATRAADERFAQFISFCRALNRIQD